MAWIKATSTDKGFLGRRLQYLKDANDNDVICVHDSNLRLSVNLAVCGHSPVSIFPCRPSQGVFPNIVVA